MYARIRLVLALGSLLFATSCGGGGNPSKKSSVLAPEVAFTIKDVSLETDEPVAYLATITAGGLPDRWTVEPPLPEGLSLGTGRIAGTPSRATPRRSYYVTASNDGGAFTVQIEIEVIWAQFRSLAPKTNLTDSDIRHFLERTHFGFDQAAYDEILQNGLASQVAKMTANQNTSQLESVAATFLSSPQDPEGRFPDQARVSSWALHLMANNTNPFQEALAFHWHDHFATSSIPQVYAAKWMIPHMNIWRHNYVGNLRDMIVLMTRDTAMLQWLDGFLNDAGPGKEPNENFAREFFELFCLGVDVVYTEADIQEAARAFSGYRLSFEEVNGAFEGFARFDHNRHDHSGKILFGQAIPSQSEGPTERDDFEAVVNITMGLTDPASGAPRVGQWIVKNLIKAFCFEEEPQNVIDDLAIQLQNDNWDLRPMMQRFLASEMFFCDKARVGRIKGPAEYLVGVSRATGLIARADLMESELRFMRHLPTQPPSVNGWPGGAEWLSAQATMDTANLLHRLTVEQQSNQAAQGSFMTQLLPSPTATSGQAVDAITVRLQMELNETERARAIQYLDSDSIGATAPWDPADTAETETRLRGLLWILCQHPTYRVR